jgi:heme-degrading monooxygenase HmoA
MIARTWRGVVRAADAEAYADYIRRTGIAEYAATPGNRGAYLLYRIDGDRAEVVTLSFWDSLVAVQGFAGTDIDRAVFYPEDDRYLIERDLTASHYVVAASAAESEP